MNIVLASKSPRRAEILNRFGLRFEIVTADIDESCSETDPKKYAEYLAALKGRAVVEAVNKRDTLIISSDTVVAIDGMILGKPKSQEDALNMLKTLSGRTHTVVSGLSLILGEKEVCSSEMTEVKFSKLSQKEIDYYVKTGEPMDKAGSYGIQGIASLFIERINGNYDNVVGFPTNLFIKLLAKLNIDIVDLL